MSTFHDYGEYYDLMYQDKDYEAECDFVEQVFRAYSPGPIRSILEGGCGTGGHAASLVRRGYAVSGIDLSDVMVARARSKVPSGDFTVGDLRSFDLGRKFDACLCMFAVMDYITETDDLLRSLRSIRRHLDPGGLFVFDFWNGLAVLRILPSTRVREIPGDGVRILRVAEPELDAFRHLCRVHYHLLIMRGEELAGEVRETHVVRFFFPLEITHLLEEAGFEVVKICPFLEPDSQADENTWNVAAIARAV